MNEERTLSQQICELCGMKPRYKYIVKGQSTELTVDKDWLIWKFKDRKNKSVFKVIKVIKTYPNFENPENFVKLYELMIDEENTLTGFIVIVLTHLNCLPNIPCNRKSYLQVLLAILQEKSIQQTWIEKIKQSIRDYDGWVWE